LRQPPSPPLVTDRSICLDPPPNSVTWFMDGPLVEGVTSSLGLPLHSLLTLSDTSFASANQKFATLSYKALYYLLGLITAVGALWHPLKT